MPVAGASQLRTVPGVARLPTQPSPSPLTTDRTTMTAPATSPARRPAGAPAGASGTPVAQPLPADVDDAEGGRHLDGGRQGAQDHPPDRVLRAGPR